MTKNELIKHLQEIEGNLDVFIHGYEGGVGYATKPVRVEVQLDCNSAWYYGKHEVIDEGYEPSPSGGAVVDGILL